MKDLNLESLEKDKADLEQKIQTLQKQLEVLRNQSNNAQVQLCRLDGALGYINDNIKKLVEVEK